LIEVDIFLLKLVEMGWHWLKWIKIKEIDIFFYIMDISRIKFVEMV